ncbi:MAG: helix-turn-helix transcriptional regulator [Desulfosporosinus sp.]|nr:helix-turn-helix transcriptional regulator [Desulfosporosinus sp.]
MAREQFQNLTEPMYYILMSLLKERCGVDIMEAVDDISKGRVRVGPGTLYSLLGKFEKENMIRETEVQGRKKYLSGIAMEGSLYMTFTGN